MTSISAQITSQGKDFWLAFMENIDIPGQPIELYLISTENANVQLTSSVGNYSNTKALTPGVANLVILPRELMSSGEGLSNKSIHITSDKDISVYAINKMSQSADASTILPTQSIGINYVAMAHAEPNLVEGSSGSNLLFVATQDNTEIEIIPSVNTLNGWSAGDTRTIQLNAGEVFDLRSNQDLTGTKAREVSAKGYKPFSVFGGSKYTNVGDCGVSQGHLYEQVPPILALGKKYLAVPYTNRNGGDVVKVVAANDGTIVSIAGEADVELNAGEYFVINDYSEPKFIEANSPILIAQLSKSSDCDNSKSDPFLINLVPLESRVRDIRFRVMNAIQVNEYYITIISANCNAGSVSLDGADITDQMQTIDNNKYITLPVSAGDHSVSSEEGILVYVYGYGDKEGYGYLAGAGFEDFDLAVALNNEVLGPAESVVCVNSEVEFTAEFNPNIIGQSTLTSFIWDFGDGITGNGLTTTHIYQNGGFYDVVLYASSGDDSCGSYSTIIKKQIEASEVEVGVVNGSQSVCEFSVGIEYEVVGSPDNTYQWTIQGGEIILGANSTKVTVNWFGSNNQAKVSLESFNQIGCSSGVLDYPVLINNVLEPPQPISDDPFTNEACLNSGRIYQYHTPATIGSTYQWATNAKGRIQGNSNSNMVEVVWEESGEGKLWFTEQNINNNACEGVSDTLFVQVYEELQINELLTEPSCLGDSDGKIHIDITGGKPGIRTIEWADGLGSSTEITGLSTGQYTVTVLDEIECAITKVINLGEPGLLEVQDVVTQPPLCFQDNNGQAQVFVTGGTPNANGGYTFEWRGNGLNQNTNEGIIGNLAPGSYEVTVRDINDCSVSYSFDIQPTSKLEADLDALINTSICPNTSEGTAFIDAKGGTPDYQFFWSNMPTVDDKNASNLSKGDYTVRIVDANGCETSLTIDVTERLPKIFIPNAFSPNGDNINDTFKPVADCAVTFSMQVYNKWGSVIFSTQNLSEGWDERFKGDMVQSGEYSYVIFYAGTINGATFEETYRGGFKLIR